MFARRTAPPSVIPEPVQDAPRKGPFGRLNPHLVIAGAATLFLTTGATAVLALGDPHAGAPRARARIAAPAGRAEPAGWRQALAPETPGPAPVTMDTLDLTGTPATAAATSEMPTVRYGTGIAPQISEAAAATAGPMGEAVITLPGGGTLPSASGPAAGTPTSTASALPAAPIAGLSQPGPNGALPIPANGRTPFQAYQRPFTPTGQPRVAIVIGGLGMNADYTRAAIERLPAEVTLSFVPYAEGLQGWIDQARAHGHEVMLELPMEPTTYPADDPGPYTLMAEAQPAETTRRLEWLLGRATGYMGVTNYMGSRFLQGGAGLGLVTQALRTRGVAFFDDGSARSQGRVQGLVRASADRIIDDQQSAETIDQALLQLEATALQRGSALGAGFAYPVTLEQVARWAGQLQGRGYQLSPASAIARG